MDTSSAAPLSLGDFIITDKVAWATLRALLESPLFFNFAEFDTGSIVFQLHYILWHFRKDRSHLDPVALHKEEKRKNALKDKLKEVKSTLQEIYNLLKECEEDVREAGVQHAVLSDEPKRKIENLVVVLGKDVNWLLMYLEQERRGIPTRHQAMSLETFIVLEARVNDIIAEVKRGRRRSSRFAKGGQQITQAEKTTEWLEIAEVFLRSGASPDIVGQNEQFILDYLERLLELPIDESEYLASRYPMPPSSSSTDSTSRIRYNPHGGGDEPSFVTTHTPSSSPTSSNSVHSKHVRFEGESPPISRRRRSVSGRARPVPNLPQDKSFTPPHSDDELHTSRPRHIHRVEPRPEPQRQPNNPGFNVRDYIRERQARAAVMNDLTEGTAGRSRRMSRSSPEAPEAPSSHTHSSPTTGMSRTTSTQTNDTASSWPLDDDTRYRRMRTREDDLIHRARLRTRSQEERDRLAFEQAEAERERRERRERVERGRQERYKQRRDGRS